MNNTIFKVLGGVLTFSGISIWLNPSYFSSRFRITFDFTVIKWPFGGILIILGIFFIWSSLRSKNSKHKDERK
jgi:putative Mn2+ efflux pump MntP